MSSVGSIRASSGDSAVGNQFSPSLEVVESVVFVEFWFPSEVLADSFVSPGRVVQPPLMRHPIVASTRRRVDDVRSSTISRESGDPDSNSLP